MTRTCTPVDVEERFNSYILACPVYWMGVEIEMKEIIVLPFVGQTSHLIWYCELCTGWHSFWQGLDCGLKAKQLDYWLEKEALIR